MATEKNNTKKTNLQIENIAIPKESTNFPIVAIGASAGGLIAIEQFFKKMPIDSGIGFVVIQHAAPDQHSILGDLIHKVTKMKVYEVEDGMEVKPNCIYVIPRNHETEILNKKLLHTATDIKRGMKLSVDFLFSSLAIDQKENAICIILSGSGSDGTHGVKAIKENGGVAIAQSPSSATYDDMPQNAINTGLIDFILKPEDIPEKLINYIPNIANPSSEKIINITINENYIPKIITYLHSKTGHDFSLYKQNTIIRRISRRMTVNKIEKIENYYEYLRDNYEEVEIFFSELLIGVTNFFRDPEAYEVLKEKIVSRILHKRDFTQPIRIWISGCSTGEEAYSMAILFYDEMRKKNQEYKLQIFATDIDSNAITTARQGIYPANIVADVPKELLHKYFTKAEDTFCINKNIREMIVFAEQSVIKDPPFSKLDLISCRNLMIYLSPELQERILPLFNYSLNNDGFLFLGSSETLGKSAQLFSVIDRRWKLFKVNKTFAALENFTDVNPLYKFTAKKTNIQQVPKSKHLSFIQIVENTLLKNFKSTIVLIDEKYQIHYVHQRTGRYLELAEGNQNTGIIEMAREGLRVHLTTALLKVISDKKPVYYENINVKTNGNYQLINLSVLPVKQPDEAKGLMLVVFEDIENKTKDEVQNQEIIDADNPNIKALDNELKTTKNRLRFTIEELEATNEELKSTNEELQSSNEELQSTNEELETSKEELQSVNEELVTVNSEHQNKIEELAIVNNDLNNLLSNTDIGTIFLDNELCIKKFTPKITNIIRLIETDIGRPLEDIVIKLNYNELVVDAQTVLNTLNTKEIEVSTKDNKWYLLRIMPYRTIDNYIDGVVITIIDITKIKSAEKVLKEKELLYSEEKFKSALKSSSHSITIAYVNRDLRYTGIYNPHSDFKVEDLIGKRDTELSNNEGTVQLEELKKKVLESGKDEIKEITFPTSDGLLTYSVSANPLYNVSGDIIGVATCSVEINNNIH